MIPQGTRKPFCLIKIAYTGAYLEHDFLLLLFGIVKTWWISLLSGDENGVDCGNAQHYRSDSAGRAGELTLFSQARMEMICIAYDLQIH